MNKNLVIKFIILYLVVITIFTTFLIYDFNDTKEKYLNSRTNQHYLEFKAIYNEHKNISNVIFDTQINQPEIVSLFRVAHKSNNLQKNIVREKLFSLLEAKYEKLKEYDLKQLHFHLPNNDSFLRMHRPKKFGDNLTNIRATVEYVNEKKEYIHGFEEGRIFNGFRFVYPMFWKKEHIGSVEISFSALALVKAIENTFHQNSNFLIRKDIVEKKVFEEEKKNYIQSPQKDFYFEKNVYEKYTPITNEPIGKEHSNRVKEGKPFSFYQEIDNILKTVIPIKNPISKEVVAVLCFCEKDQHLSEVKKNLILTIILVYLGFAIILYLFYRQKIVNERLKNLNKDLDKRINIEIKKSRKKDSHILNQSKIIAIGELLNNISHQWRQPLNVITTSATGLKLHKEMNSLDDETFSLLTTSINEQAQYMSKIIETFKQYLSGNENIKRVYCVQDRIDNAIDLIISDFEYNYIKIEKIYVEEKLYIEVGDGQFIQTIINILNNAKDALIKNNSEDNRLIKIEVKEKKEHTLLVTIEDNAGGIPVHILDKVFEPYFTTKHESLGTGISLYNSYQTIVQELKGNLYVKNRNYGAKFYIEIPLIT